MHIIIKGNNSKPTSKGGASYQGFTPHLNHAIDKKPIWIATRQQYDRELKSRGLQPATGEVRQPKRVEYKVKPETRKVVEAIRNQTDKRGNFNPSGTLKAELIKRKVIRPMKEVKEMQAAAEANTKAAKKGGFF